MWKPAEELSITEKQRTALKAWVAAKTSPQRSVLCARICLLSAEGLPNRVIAKTPKTSRSNVIQWRKRFEEQGPQGLAENAPHGLSSRALPAEKIKAIVEATLQTTPPDATHWSTRTMAQAMGVSNATVFGMRTGCNVSIIFSVMDIRQPFWPIRSDVAASRHPIPR